MSKLSYQILPKFLLNFTQRANVKKKKNSGFSLIEILIVIAIFAILSVVATQSVFLTLRGSRKSESTVDVKENLDRALSIIERHFYAAKKLDCVSSTSTEIVYSDLYGTIPNPTFSCLETAPGGDPGYIASGSSNIRLTPELIDVTSCQFTCIPKSPDLPGSVEISVTAHSSEFLGVEDANVTTSKKVILRNYEF